MMTRHEITLLRTLVNARNVRRPRTLLKTLTGNPLAVNAIVLSGLENGNLNSVAVAAAEEDVAAVAVAAAEEDAIKYQTITYCLRCLLQQKPGLK